LSASAVSFARRIDLVSGMHAARVVRGAMETKALMRALAALRRAGGPGLIAAPLPAAALCDPAAFDETAKAHGLDPRATNWEIAANGIDAEALEALARLRARGWGLGLRMAPGPSPALDTRSRALFSTYLVTGDWADAQACGYIQMRVHAARAQGAQIVWAGDDGPDGPRLLVAEGYDAADIAGPVAAQTALARAMAEQASSFSIR